MSKLVFGRSYKVTFEDIDPEVLETEVTTIDSTLSNKGDSALQVMGVISQTLKGEGSSPSKTLKMSITNLPKALSESLGAASILRVKLRLGYDYKNAGETEETSNIPEVFVGEVISFKSVTNGSDFVTTIEAIEGNAVRAGSVFTGTYRKGTKLGDIFKDVVTSFKDVYTSKTGSKKVTFDGGVGISLNLGSKRGLEIKGDRSFEGTASTLLDELCKEFNLTWLLTEGSVYIYKKDGKITEKAVLQTTLFPEYVIGDVTRSYNTAGKSKKEEADYGEIRVTTFLNPEISAEINYRIPKTFDENDDPKGTVAGLYKPVAWTHKFNYRGVEWHTEMVLNTEREEQ